MNILARALRRHFKTGGAVLATAAVMGGAAFASLAAPGAVAAPPPGSAGTFEAIDNMINKNVVTSGLIAQQGLHVVLDCPVPAADNQIPVAFGFVAEAGHELPAVPAGGAGVETLYKFSNDQVPDPGYPMMTKMYREGAGSTQSLGGLLTPGKAYSMGYVCGTLQFGDPAVYKVVPGADGKAIAAWMPFYLVDAEHWSNIAPPKATPTVAVAGTAESPTSIKATATVSNGGATAADANGQVEFYSNGASVGKAPVAGGVATTTLTGLTASTAYKLTAKFIADAAEARLTDSALSPEASVTTNAAPSPSPTASPSPSATGTPTASASASAGAVIDGGTIEPGKQKTVELPTGTFHAGDTVSGVMHSDPIALTDKATANADGSVTYTFTAPAGLEAGAHKLVLTGTPSGVTATVNYTVAGGPEGTGGNGGSGGGAGDVRSANTGFTPLTGWIGTAASTPAGAAGLFGTALALAAAIAVGWNLLWKRRAQREH